MNEPLRSRSEQRASYRWPLWFRTLDAQETSQGLMVDVSAGGLAFLCAGDGYPLQVGERLRLRFHIPRYDGLDNPQGAVCVTRMGRICSTELTEHGSRRVGVQFDHPLSLTPADELRLIRLATEARISATCGEPAKAPSTSGKDCQGRPAGMDGVPDGNAEGIGLKET